MLPNLPATRRRQRSPVRIPDDAHPRAHTCRAGALRADPARRRLWPHHGGQPRLAQHPLVHAEEIWQSDAPAHPAEECGVRARLQGCRHGVYLAEVGYGEGKGEGRGAGDAR